MNRIVINALGSIAALSAQAAVTPWQGVDWQNRLGAAPSFVNGSGHLVVPINETNLGIAWSEALTPLFPAFGPGSFRSGVAPFFQVSFLDTMAASPLIVTEHASPVPGDGFAVTCGASGGTYGIAWQNYKTGQQGSFAFALRSSGVKTVRVSRIDLGIAYRIDVHFNSMLVFSSLLPVDQVVNPYLGDVYLAGVGINGQHVTYTSFTAGLFDPGSDLETPIDLIGGYLEPSSNAGASVFGTASASTSEWYLFGSGQRVREKSLTTTLADVDEATYTPFSDSRKKPGEYATPMLGRRFAFEIALSGAWSQNANDASEFGIFIYDTPAGPGDASVRFRSVSGDYEVSLWDSSPAKQSSQVDSTGATIFRVEVAISPTGTMGATVTRMNGNSIGTSFTLGPIASGLSAAGPHAFRAGFETSTAIKGRAIARIMRFVADAPPNALYVYCDMPYVKPGDSILYRLGMANLAQPVYGFQAFLSNTLPASQTFSAAGYTGLPFTTHIINPITTTLWFASGVDFFGIGVLADATLAGIQFLGAAQGSARLLIQPDNGNAAPTRFSDTLGQPVIPERMHSNVVVVDGTAPGLSNLTASQNAGPNLIPSGTAIQGVLDISVKLTDGGSGLSAYPTGVVDFAPIGTNSGEDVFFTMYSGDGNEFRAEVPITPTTPCGPAELRIHATDDSGNTGSTVGQFNVNTAQAVINVTLANVQLPINTTVTRWVRVTLGGTGGANPPIVADVLVAFTDPDGVGVGNPLPATGVAIVTHLPCGVGTALSVSSAKDPLHTLRKQAPLNYLGNNQYFAAVALMGGDCNDDNVIDVLDFGVFASQYGQAVGANTFIGQPPPHSDFSCNGIVDTADYTFIAAQFLSVGDPPPGNFLFERPTPKKRATVKELLAAGAKYAEEFDSNGDGWVEYWEIEHWLVKRMTR